jgi:hypothetical protein
MSAHHHFEHLRPDFEVAHVKSRVEDSQPWNHVAEPGLDATGMSLDDSWTEDDYALFVCPDWDCWNLGRFSPA